MPDFDVQVVMKGLSNLPEDVFVNTLHFSAAGPLDWDESADSLGPQIVDAWKVIAFYPEAIIAQFQVKLYNPDDPPPRQPKTFTGTFTQAPASASLPTEVALCLSYFTDRNLPRKRGRIYIGPMAQSNNASGRPIAGLQTSLLNLADRLSAVGGANVDWQHVSTVTGERARIQNCWVDNAWDTQRRRGLAPTSRVTRVVSG